MNLRNGWPIFFRHLLADGKFTNLREGSTRSVHVDIHGTGGPGKLTLVENTVFSDGEHHRKTWSFTKAGEGRYVGERADLVGKASVVERGNEIIMSYRAYVPTKEGKIFDLDFNEHYVFTDAGALENNLRVSWHFLPVGEAHLIVRKAAK